MRRLFVDKWISRRAAIAGLSCAALGALYFSAVPVSAQEQAAEVIEEALPAEDLTAENSEDAGDAAAARTGTYSVEAGWSADSSQSTQDQTVYKQDAYLGVEGTSTITCSYVDTNYSVYEYEQLRDMLTNNLLYSNVNAQISTSAVYTDAKDYLYILIVDDSAQDYRNIYCYVVGDYRCFCVDVKEYRQEAEQLQAQAQKTPQEAGQSIAEKFVWD